MEFCYKFNALKGKQANKDYYVAMVPLKMLSKLFVSDDEYVPPEYRAQRKLNESRIPVISKYILENRDNYVFSSLAASVDGMYNFLPYEDKGKIGVLEISMDSRFLINDGQHRKAAIIEALKENVELGEETIPIVFFFDQELMRSQQIFTDLNKNAVKTSNSISKLYDSRDVLSVMTRNVIWKIEFLNIYTDKETDNLGKYSSHLFTLNTFHRANQLILKNKYKKDCEDFLFRYWKMIVDNMLLWQELQNKEITKIDLRQNYIATQNVVIHALGRVGNYFYEHPEIDMSSYLEKIKFIEWSRNARCWHMRAVNKNGKILTNSKAVLLISNEIKKNIGIPLSKREINEEEKLNLLLER